MKNYYRFFAAAAIVFAVCFPHALKAINPLYQLSARNVQVGSGSRSNNELTFDITIYHSNSGQSGPFEFALGQYIFEFNPAIANGGILTYSIIPGSCEFTNQDAIPRFPTVMGNQLRLNVNQFISPGSGPIVSDVYPGTRIVKMLLTTSAPSFANVPLDLHWRDSTFGDPYTEIRGYINGVSTGLNSEGTLIVDDPNPPLPVELSGFNSTVNGNNVTLRWTTESETNNSGFEIQRMKLGEGNSQWIRTGFVNGSGTIQHPESYSFSERLNTGKYEYRLKQIDYNGNHEYFNLNDEVNIGIPGAYALSQNYPNPFNPETVIDYALAQSGSVRIVLYDVMGREVMTILNENRDAGYHSIKFNASGLTSGIYLYKISSGNFFETKRMMLIR